MLRPLGHNIDAADDEEHVRRHVLVNRGGRSKPDEIDSFGQGGAGLGQSRGGNDGLVKRWGLDGLAPGAEKAGLGGREADPIFLVDDQVLGIDGVELKVEPVQVDGGDHELLV